MRVLTWQNSSDAASSWWPRFLRGPLGLGRTAFAILLCLVPLGAGGTPISWAAASSGNWNTKGNWSPPQVPAAGDDVSITVAGTYTVTLDVDATVNSLMLGGSSGTQTLSNGGHMLRMNAASAINANGRLDMSGGTVLPFAVALTSSGIVDWTGGTIFNLAVAPSGLVNVSGAADKIASGATTNAGTVIWTGLGAFQVSGGSNFQNQSGGNFDVQTDAALTGGGVFNNNAGGTFTKSVTSGTTPVHAPFDNSGTVSIQTGALNIDSYTQFAGATHLSGGNLMSTGPTSSVIVIQGGVLDGDGTVTGDLRLDITGQMSPGTSPGVIHVIGSYTEFGGTYDAEIGGTTAGTQYDQIDVTGTVSLGATLNVSLIGGFTPAAGQQFTIVNNDGTDAVASHYTGLNEGAMFTVGGVQFQISYRGGDGNDVVLTVVGVTVGESFFTLTPCRVIDTRGPTGPYGGPPLAAKANRTFVLAGQCLIPPTAKAVSVNVTVSQSTAAGDLRLLPGGSALPLVSTINYSAGQTRANNGVAGLGASGDLTVHCDQASGTVDLILDVTGYFQ